LNQGFTYAERIDQRGHGHTVLDYLAAHYAHATREEWVENLALGRVLLEDRPTCAAERLQRGQQLSWLRPPWEEPEVPLGYAILLEDDDLLAVAKPSGLPTLPGGGYLEHTLLALVRRRHPQASPIHRLGRGTSGVVLFGRTAAAGRALCGALREHRMSKIYRALVQGAPLEDSFTVDTPIGPIAHPRLGTVHGASPLGRAAISHVRVLERRSQDSLVEVHIETGRPHQIRIHLATCGHPLVGDPLYVAGGGVLDALPGAEGYLLHAFRLTFPHPRSGIQTLVECQPPACLRPVGLRQVRLPQERLPQERLPQERLPQESMRG
jgi:23S rRNA pseudouridine1911/1915/1917 synthase